MLDSHTLRGKPTKVAPKPLPSQEILNRVFSYDEEVGELYWIAPRMKKQKDVPAGCLHNQGYIAVSFEGQSYLAHRIIWAMVYGEIPPEIDHINGNRMDNRLSNLMAVNRSGNQHNVSVRKDSSSGVAGVNFCKIHQKWKARIQVNGVRKSLGYFDSLEEAAAARASAKSELGDYHG